MILITRREAFYMRDKGFGHYVHTVSITHKSRGKTYYLTENPRVLTELENFRLNTKVS